MKYTHNWLFLVVLSLRFPNCRKGDKNFSIFFSEFLKSLVMINTNFTPFSFATFNFLVMSELQDDRLVSFGDEGPTVFCYWFSFIDDDDFIFYLNFFYSHCNYGQKFHILEKITSVLINGAFSFCSESQIIHINLNRFPLIYKSVSTHFEYVNAIGCK